jgi:hypothetical protein
LILFILFGIFTVSSVAVVIKITVEEVLDLGEFVNYNSEISNEVFKITDELYNKGSVGYVGRLRLDIFNGTKIIHTSWSSEAKLQPGEKKSLYIYWYNPSIKGNFSARIRTYYANEISEKNFNLSINNDVITNNPFKFLKVRVYENEIRIFLTSNEDLKNVIIDFSNYPISWIIEQKKIDIRKDEIAKVEVNYKPDLWFEKSVKVTIFTEDGKNFGEYEFTLKKDPEWKRVIDFLIPIFYSLFK